MRRIAVVALVAFVALAGSVLMYRSVFAVDGSGTNAVSPTTATAGSTGNTHAFTYTAAEDASSGEVSIAVPAGWSAPQGSAGSAGYVAATSASGVIANVLNALDSATGWSASPPRMALSADTGDKQEGSASLLNTIDAGASANEQWYFNYGGASNWGAANSTNGSRVGMWLRSSVGTASGNISWQDDNTASLASPEDTLALPALTANTWTYASVTLGAARTAQLSYGFRYTTDIGAATFKADSISSLFDAADTNTSWNGDSGVSDSLLTTSGNFQEGTGAIRCTYATSAAVGAKCRRSAAAVDNITVGPGTTVSFWARSSVALSAGDFQWMDDDSQTLTSPEDTVNLPALAANTWTYVTLTAANSSNKSVRSYGFNQVVDKGAFTLDIDAIGKQIDAADATTGWTAAAGGGMTVSSDSVTFHEGTASLKDVITSVAVAGDKWYQTLGAAQDWSGYTTVGVWMRSTVATTAGQLKFEYSSASDLSSPIASLNVGALSANTWSYQTFALTGTRTSVNSFGINYAADIGAATVYLDDFLIGPGVPTFPGGGIIRTRLLSLTSGQTAVITYGSGGGSSGATAPTTSGVSTFTTQSRVSDSGTLTDISSSPTITVNPDATSQFTVNDPGNITAGTRAAYVVTRKDQFGNLVTSGAQTVYLYSDSTGTNDAFYNVSSGGSPVASVTIADTASTANFWYYDDAATTATITTSDNATAPDGTTNIDDATDSITVSAAATLQFSLDDPGGMTAGTRLGYVVTRKDAFGNVTTSGAQTVYLYSDSTGNEAFYAASSGGSPIASVSIADTASTANFWYYDDLAGSATVTASDNATAPDAATGIDDATDGVTVSADATSQFTLNDPGSMTAGTRLGYVVTRKDQFGNATTSGAQTVYLYSDSSGSNDVFYAASSGGSPIASVSIADTASTANFWYYDDLATTATVTASDNATAPDGTTGIDDAADSVTISAATASQFLLDDPGDTTAGTRLGYVVTRRDAFNNLVTSGAQTVYLYSDSTNSPEFYAASSGGSPIASISILDTASTANFWYYDELAGSATVTVSDNATAPDGATGIDDATDSVTVSQGATSQFTLNDPGDIAAGTRAAYTVTRRDSFGNPVTSGSETVYLYSDSTGNEAFYDASSGGSVIASATISNGFSSVNFWYYDDKVGTFTVTASDNATVPDGATGIDDATDGITISAAAASQFLLDDPGSVAAGNRLGYVVTRKDAFNNLVTSGAQTVYLYSDSTGNEAFYAASSGGSPILSVSIADTASTANFWYYDDLATTATVTASDNATAADGATGIDDATDGVTISAATTSQFVLDDPGNMTAGTRLGYVVTRKDAFGNVTTSGAQTVYLYSDSIGNEAFYAASSGGSPIASVSIADTASTANFWYYDDLATSATVTASDNATAADGATGIDDAADGVTVSADATSQFVLDDPGNMTAGTRLGYVVTRKDQFGNATTSGAQTVYLYSSSTGTNKAFYAASSGGSPVASVSIADTASTANFWYYDELAGTFTVTASDNATAPDGTTNVDDATDSVTVSSDATSQFSLNDPGDTTAGSRLGYVVTRKDQFGNATTSGAQTVYLYSDSTNDPQFFTASSGGSPVASISIADTSSTANFWYYDELAGSATVTASDNATAPDGATNVDDATDGVVISQAATSQFTLNDPGDITAGTRAAYTVTRKDTFGNPVTSGSETVYLYSDSTGNKAFYDASSGGNVIASATISNGFSSVNFWYYDDKVGAFTVTASDNATAADGATGIDDASDGIAISSAAASQFLLDDPGNMSAGTRLGYVVTRKDAFNNLVTSGAQTVYLYSDSTGNPAFYAASSGGSPIASVSIADTASTANFWYYDDFSTTATVTASDNATSPDGTTGIDDAADGVTISAASTAQFLLDDPGSVAAGVRLGYVVTRRDAFGNLVTSGAETVYLYSDSSNSPAFYDASSGGSPVASVSIADTASTASFWYYDELAGSATVTASDNATAPDGATGIDDATDGVTVSAGTTAQFLLNDPGTMTAGERLGYVVTRKDAFGNLVTSGAETVYLYSDSSGNPAFYAASSGGSPVASVSIADTASTANFWYYDDFATTAAITASDNATAPDVATGIDDATDGVAVSAAATSQFLLNDPGDATAGERLGYVVTRKDAFGNLVTSGADTVYLYSDSSNDPAFYAASSGGSPVASVSISDASSTANFWYYDELAGSATVTASDNATAPDGATNVDDASDGVTVAQAATAQFTLNDPGDITAGARAAYTVTRKDAFGNPVTSGSQTVYLYSDSTGNKAFYDASSGGTIIASVAISEGFSSANFWYEDDLAGTFAVTASDNATAPDGATGIDDATDSITVSAAATSQFLLDNPGGMVAGTRLGYVVTRKDAFGNLVTSGAETVYLYSDSSGSNDVFYAASSGGSPIASISIADTASTANFWYYDDFATTATITASDNATAPDGATGIDDATDGVTVSAAATAQFLLDDPGDTTAGTRLGYVVTRKDAFGNLVTSGAETVYLYSDSSNSPAFYAASSGGSPVASVTIADTASVASFWYYDELAGSATVTASDNATAPDGATGTDDAADLVVVGEAATSQFLLNDPGDIAAGTRAAYVVTRKDSLGNPTTSGSQTVHLSSDSTGNFAFYDASSGGSAISSVAIADGFSTASFWYYDDAAGTFAVTASDNATAPDGATGIDDATDGVTITAAATSQFVLDDPGATTAGERLGYVVTRKDAFGNLVTSGAETVYLYSDSSNDPAFYAASSGGSPVASVSISDASSTANFWYYDELAGSATVTASDNATAPDGATNVDDASDGTTVAAGETRQYSLGDPGDMTAGTRLGYTVTRKDAFGNVTTSGTETVSLYSDSTGNAAFYDASSGGTVIASIDVTDGNSTAGFWYYDDKVGTFTVTVSDNATAPDGLVGIDDATDGVTVSAATAAQFFLDDPGGMVAGDRLGYVVTRKDAFGNLVTSGAQSVYLYSTSAGSNKAFYNVSSGGSPVALVSIADAASTASFWYYDDLATTATIAASDNATAPDGTTGIDDATDSVTISAATTSQFLLDDPGDTTAGERLGYVVTRKDQFGNLVTSGSEVVSLYSDSAGTNDRFYNSASGGSQIVSVTVDDASSTASFWYSDELAGSATITTSDNATAPDGTAGIDDATDGVAVAAAVRTQFLFINDPGDMTAGTRLGYVVTRKDAFGNDATSGIDIVHLYGDSTGNMAFYDVASGGSSLNTVYIEDGSSTANFWYYDDKAGAFTVTASDSAVAPNGTTGVDDATDGVTISAAAASQFLLDDPGDMTAGTRLGYVVTRKDEFGNATVSGAQTVYLYSTSVGSNKAFYAASSGGSPVASVSIADTASTASFWYYDELAAAATITASDNATAPDGTAGIDDATDSVTISADATRQFLLSDPGDMVAGTRLGYVVSREDQFGNFVTSGTDTVYLYGDSTGNPAFLDASSGGSPVLSIDIGDGLSSANFWHYDDLVGTFAVTASDNATAPDGVGGIDDATDSVTVTFAATAQFSLDDPGDMTAGTRLGYVVTRKDAFGNVVTSGTDTAYLYSDSTGSQEFFDASSGGSAIASVDITNGNSTASFWNYDDKAGSSTVTASDSSFAPDGAVGIDDAADSATVSAAATSQFALNDPGSATAGTRLGYVVTRRDAFGNLVSTGADTVYLYSDSSNDPAFFAASSGGSPVASVSISDASSTANFWYYDELAGSATVTASDNATVPDGTTNVDDATDSVAVTAAATSEFSLSDPGGMTAGERLGYVVTRRDAFGNPATSGAQTVYLYSDSANAPAFFAASSGGSPVASVSIADSSSTASFWYYDELAGSATVTTSDNATSPDGTTGVDDATDGVTVSAAATAQFSLDDPGSVTAGERLGYVVTRKDAFGNLVASGADTVYLYGNSTGNYAFYDASSGGSPVASVTVLDASSTAAFWYYDDTAGTFEVTASDNASAPDGATGIDDATDGVTVSAAATAQFSLNDPGDTTAGERLGYVVTRRDAFGNLATSGTDTAYLSSDSTGNPAFFAVSSGGSPVSSIDIPEASSSAAFWYYDEATGTATVTASDNAAPDGAAGIDDATDSVVVGQATTSQFLLNDPGDIVAGSRAAYTVTRKDPFDNAVTSGAETVYLYGDSTGNEAFYDASSGGTVIGSVTISDGFSSASFWYYDDKVGTFNVTVSDNAAAPDGATGIDDATDAIAVSAASASQFLLSDPGDMVAGDRLGYVVTRKDAFGNLVVAGAQTVSLYADSAGSNEAFYAASSGGSPVASVEIADTESSAAFWYYDDLATSATVTASDNATSPDGAAGIDDATDVVAITAASTSKFTLNDPGDMTTGTRLGYVVTRTDAFDNLVTAGTDTAYPYSDSIGSYAFYNAAAAGSIIFSVDITEGNSTGAFWYYEEQPGTISITASDNETAPDGAAGIDDATDAVVVTMPTPVRFVIVQPADTDVETAAEITVRAEDGDGDLASGEQDDVTLVADGSATGAGLVDIVNGIGTIQISDTVIEVVHLSLVDSEGTGLDVTSTKDLSVTVGPTRQFALNDPGDMTAGTRIGYEIARKDASGNPVTDGTDTVYLYADSAGNYAFYDASSGGSPVASVDVTDGNSTAAFWYYDDAAATVSVTASDDETAPDGTSGTDDASDDVVVSAAATSEFLLSDPGDMTAGERLGYEVTRRDQFGNLVTAGSEPVYLYTDSTGNALFFDAATDGNQVTQIAIGDGSSVGAFWYYDDKVASVTVAASDNSSAADGTAGINDASDSPAISAAAIAQFLLDDPGNMTTGTRVEYTVTRKDAFGNLVTTGSDTAYLYTTSSGIAPAFYDAVVDGNEISSVDIGDGFSSAIFWYFDDTAGTWDIAASDNSSAPDGDGGVDDDTDSLVVTDIPIVATKFVILDPTDGTAGDSITVTVRAEDDFGSVDTTYQGDVTLAISGSGTGAGLVDIVNGVGTRDVSDTVAEEVTLSLADTEATGLLVGSVRNLVFSTGPTAQFSLGDPGDTSAGTRIAYEAARADAFGNPVTEGSETAYLYSESGSPATFFDASSGGSQISSVTFDGGSSTVAFWYVNEQAVDETVSVSDNAGAPDGADGIADATDAVVISAGPTSTFLLSDPGDMSVDTRVAYSVTREDAFGNLVTAGAETAYLFTTSTETSPAFYDAASDGNAIVSIELGDGLSVANFWYFDDTAGTWDISASDNPTAPDADAGIDDGTDSIVVTEYIIVATKFVILDPDNGTVGDTVAVTVRAEDEFGSADTAYQSDVTLVLSGSAIGGGLVDIVNGIGTMGVSDAAAETVALSLSDTEGTGLDVTSTREMTFESAGDSGGGGGGGGGSTATAEPEPSPTVLRFDGAAYPGAAVTLMGNRSDGTSVALAQIVVSSADGTFSIEYAGPFDGIASYEIRVADPDGLVAPAIPLSPTIVPNVLTSLTFFAAPTMDLLHYTVLRGLSFSLFGYGTPGGRVELSVDGAEPSQLARIGDDGSWRMVLETLALDFGPHVLRMRQVSSSGIASEYGTGKAVYVSRLLNRETDLNGDDQINIADWSIFLVRWSSMESVIRLLLDFNGDGTVDIADFSIFIRSIRK